MIALKNNLLKQLLAIAIIMVGIVFIGLGIILPKSLVPIYEKNIYSQLKQPLELVGNDLEDNDIIANMAYLYVTSDNEVITSANLSSIIPISTEQILSKIDEEYGKFKYQGKSYYYNTSTSDHVYKIAITNSNYIAQMRQDILYQIFPVILITIALMLVFIIWWARRLVLKIEFLKNKVDNLDNDSFIFNDKVIKEDDELHALSKAIDHMRLALKKQEEFKNQMYQSISHDLKTPLTVINSYLEAIEDGVEDEKQGLKIIKEQIIKLETKVRSLLYLNKLSYIQDNMDYKNEKVDIALIADKAISDFKIQRPDIKWELTADKKAIFKGTYDMWETIIDNLLNNFVRYAKKHIKIIVKNGRIILYNDGPNIRTDILDDLFTPYKKGIKGQFGLGLSIVKKTLSLFEYEIIVKNEKNGVSFIIK
ncbi:MAG: HAMP domain-containing sensor histidine kinase [Bacilli bacterium]|nr:HAMP domain-containing sensor histidine kinase [Bacilli bacterium]